MNQESKQTISQIFDTLSKISVSGEDVLRMADVLRALQQLYAQPTIESPIVEEQTEE